MKRIEAPVGAQCLDDVQMCEQKDRLRFSGAVITRHQVFKVGIIPVHVDVGIRETGIAQAFRHSLRGSGHVCRGVGGIDVD